MNKQRFQGNFYRFRGLNTLPDDDLTFHPAFLASGRKQRPPRHITLRYHRCWHGEESRSPNSASIGTRAYQMALFVLFETGLQMMADNPTLYYRNDECTRFITQVPQTWDETIALEAKAGEYAIVAKRKGEQWYIGGMTNNRERERVFNISLDFLQEGKNYLMTSFEDGINADHQAMDYRKQEQSLKKGNHITVRLARNGGFAAVIR